MYSYVDNEGKMFENFEIKIPPVSFESNLAGLVLKLEALKSQYKLAPHTPAFLQLRELFSMMESLQSARIEGNRTTISDYADAKFDTVKMSQDNIEEIRNIENAISYVDYCFSQQEGFKISHIFLKELHSIVTSGLKREGSRECGAYRRCNVKISNAKHIPPEAIKVQDYMDKLVEWINKDNDKIQTLSLKVAIAHHLFTWIHPFDNGNGRMSRVLTYAMLKQYGFDMVYLLNPSAVFCIDREKYFEKLQIADKGTDDAYLEWCEYVLEGLNCEMKKIIRLLDCVYLNKKILDPAIDKLVNNGTYPYPFGVILHLCLIKDNNQIKLKDVQEIFPELTARQINFIITKMAEEGYLKRTVPKGRIYQINLLQKHLVKSILYYLEQEKFIELT